LPAPATFDPRNFAADFHRTSRTRRPPASGQMCLDGDKGSDGGREAGRAANITNSTPLVCLSFARLTVRRRRPSARRPPRNAVDNATLLSAARRVASSRVASRVDRLGRSLLFVAHTSAGVACVAHHSTRCSIDENVKKVKVAHTRLQSVGFRS